MIYSKANPIVKETIKLKQRKYRNKTGLFIVEGEHLVEEAYQANMIEYVFTNKDEDYKDCLTYFVDENILKLLSDVITPKPLIAVCKKVINQGFGDNILLLDNIQDPGNIGTLIRSALAFGFKSIVAKNSVDFYNDKVIRSSQGALFRVGLFNDDLVEFIRNNDDYRYLATDLNTDNYLENIEVFEGKIALILGNEGMGVSQEVLNEVSERIKIRIKDVESLNVGVAGSIIMYEIMKRQV